MALTIEQEQALLALLNEKKITLSELPAATDLSDDDLMLIRQGILDKSVNSSVMKRHFTPLAASLTETGITKLSNAVNSNDESISATSKAVKLAYDLASSKLSILPVASESTSGIVQLNDTTNSVSTTQAATANAVKKTYDFANTKVKTVNGKGGIDIILSATDVDSVSASKGGDFGGNIYVNGQVVSKGNDSFRIANDNYGSYFKQDGTNFYLLFTDKGNSNGIYNSLRPFTANITTGRVSLSHGLTVTGDVQATTQVKAGNAVMTSDGNVNGTKWGGWLDAWITNHCRQYYVSDIRLGALVQGADNRIGHHPGGCNVIVGVMTWGDNRITHTYWRPLQKLINGTWYNFTVA